MYNARLHPYVAQRWHSEQCSHRDGMQPDLCTALTLEQSHQQNPHCCLINPPDEAPRHCGAGDSLSRYSSTAVGTHTVQCAGLAVSWYRIAVFARNSTGSLQPCVSAQVLKISKEQLKPQTPADCCALPCLTFPCHRSYIWSSCHLQMRIDMLGKKGKKISASKYEPIE